MKVELLAHTPDAERIVAAAAKICYSQSGIDDVMDNLTPEKTESFINMLAEIGHESPIEHATFTFGVEGVSRVLLAQLTRHRIASFSVQSQRYVRESGLNYITPPEIASSPETLAVFEKMMEADARAYDELTELLFNRHLETMLSSGMAEKDARRAAEKKAIEDARYVLPNACGTKLIVTMNTRSLYNFFRLRCCKRAQWEIREMAELMLTECLKVAPSLFASAGPPCAYGACREGKMGCGEAASVREKYRALRNTAK